MNSISDVQMYQIGNTFKELEYNNYLILNNYLVLYNNSFIRIITTMSHNQEFMAQFGEEFGLTKKKS